jgi:glycosyltransferase involved in cell wall biosynthesis
VGPAASTTAVRVTPVTVPPRVTTSSLSVVMPIRNEAADLPATIDALVTVVDGSGFDAELVLVDDGSTDGSAHVAREAVADRLPFRALSQENRGRFQARRAGVDAATGEWVLLLDGRVRIRCDALAYVHDRIHDGSRVWTAHVEVDTDGNPYGEFWKLLAELAWTDYFDDPHETSFGVEEFDRFPKGTTCFLAPRALLAEAIDAFRSSYADSRHANDDTPLIRWMSQREPINISPRFACDYRPRTTLSAFVRHSFHRGIVFLDGHGRRESSFFPVAVAFYPVSMLLAFSALRRPRIAAQAAVATGLAGAALGVARRRTASEIRTLALLAPIYAAAHGAGMWRGLALLRQRSQP